MTQTSSAPRQYSLCLCSDDFLPAATGAGSHVQQISRALASRGHHVIVLTTRRPGEPPYEVWEGVEVYRFFSIRLAGFWQALPSRSAIERVLRRHGVEIVHHHYLSIMLKRVKAVAEKMLLPQVYTYHMTVDHLTQPLAMRPFRMLFTSQIRKLCNAFDLIVVPSKNLISRIWDDGVQTPIRYITNPIIFNSIDVATEASWPRPATFMIFFAGRLNPEKNVPLLLQAFHKVAEQHPDTGLWIAGTGSQRPQLEALCRTLGIASKVHFLGFIEQVQLAKYYSACDVFVLPSLVETQGMVAMEAMRFSKPVIVTRAIVSATELVEDGVNGYIVDPKNPEELAGKLLHLLRDPDCRRRFGEAGKNRSLGFSLEVVMEELERVYHDVTEVIPNA